MRLWITLFLLTAFTTLLAGCGNSMSIEDRNATGDNASLRDPAGEEPEDPVKPPPVGGNDWSDAAVKLDATGEAFASSIANGLKASRYMEDECRDDRSWPLYGDLPVIRCKYGLGGQRAEVVMLNPGPRRLTQWLADACQGLNENLTTCMNRGYRQILHQSGGQFPVTGVVLEDMSGNGKGEAFAFREGVTIRISTFGTGTESIISASQVQAAMTATAMYTYTYGRPISVTRDQMTTYARKEGLTIPVLGTSSERKNNWHVLIGEMYRDSWKTGRSHILRAWLRR